jgi:integrative and conjugative element protein (TIGR02256 family)
MPDICWCADYALTDVFAEARRWRVRETGGALLGWRGPEGPFVTRVLGPGPKAHHGWSSFEPDGEWQNAEGAHIYRATDRQVTYLGDWHTHPRGGHKPSSQDRKTARMIAGDEAFRAPTPLYAIAHRSRRLRGDWRLTVYEVREEKLIQLAIRVVQTPPPSRLL